MLTLSFGCLIPCIAPFKKAPAKTGIWVLAFARLGGEDREQASELQRTDELWRQASL